MTHHSLLSLTGITDEEARGDCDDSREGNSPRIPCPSIPGIPSGRNEVCVVFSFLLDEYLSGLISGEEFNDWVMGLADDARHNRVDRWLRSNSTVNRIESSWRQLKEQ